MADKDFVVKNGMSVNGSILVVNSSTGSVGINTGTPDATFKVIGTANVSGNVTMSANLTVTGNVYGTLQGTANNTLNLGGVAAASFALNSSVTANATTAYSNAIIIAANATTITSGTLDTARLPATANLTTALNVGANVTLSTIQLSIGNTTVNLLANSTNISVSGATIGALTTTTVSGSGAGITSINATNITSGTLDTARLPATANLTTALNVGSVVTANTTSIRVGNVTVNSTSIIGNTATFTGLISAGSFSGVGSAITSVDASTVGGNTATTLRAYSDTMAGTAFANAVANAVANATTLAATAYSNAIIIAANATTITSGTLNTARLPATANLTTALNVGANVTLSTIQLSIGNTTVNLIANSTSIVGGANAVFNVVNASLITSGNTTVNSTLISTTANLVANVMTGNGVNITSVNASTVGGNTATTLRAYSDTMAATAFANAVANATTLAATAYSNAVTFSAIATNITSGTLDTARLPATANLTTALNVGSVVTANTTSIRVGNVTVDSTSIIGNTATFTGLITAGSLSLTTDLPITEGGTGASTAANARTNLGLGTMATQAASAVAITGGSITGITDLALADGGTGASTAANARTNLGLGTMATQAASAVAITGGTIAGTTINATTQTGSDNSTLVATTAFVQTAQSVQKPVWFTRLQQISWTGTGSYKLLFATPDFDTGSYLNTSTHRLVPAAGYYNIQASFSVFSSNGTECIVQIYKNGSQVLWTAISSTIGTNMAPVVSSTLYANGTDYFEVYLYASNIQMYVDPAVGSFFSGSRI